MWIIIGKNVVKIKCMRNSGRYNYQNFSKYGLFFLMHLALFFFLFFFYFL